MQLTLARLSWTGQAAVALGVSAAAGGLFHVFWLRPAGTHVALQERALAALRDDISRMVVTERVTPQLQRQRAALMVRLAALDGAAPREADAPRVLRDVQALAEESELWITGFKPAPRVSGAQVTEWSVAVEFDGTFASLMRFLERAAVYPRLVTVSGLRLRAREQPTPTATLSGSCRLITVVTLDSTAPAGPRVGTPSVLRGVAGGRPALAEGAP